ncbi:50S ribosomal protein L10 [Candidatus Parcubacteria bacterium]|nr:MAG: 50S ribosomal protein L10 [Candidatus Parcubacteria bacterium]
MKSKAQKAEELKKGKALLENSSFLVLFDFSRIPADKIAKFRASLSENGAEGEDAEKKATDTYMVIKKRLLGILLKEHGIDVDFSKYKVPIGTVFARTIESASRKVFRFLQDLGMENEAIVGAVDLATGEVLTPDKVRLIGQLPPREILLAQVLGAIAAPLRAMLYIMKERSQKVGAAS